MLSEEQALDVWERQIQAEIRALYFADLTRVYTLVKQSITFTTFFLSSGAAASVIGHAPAWVPGALSILAAILTAYSVAASLDSKVVTLSKLHSDWASLADAYESLRASRDAADASAVLIGLLHRDLEASKLATTNAPNDAEKMSRWTDHVFMSHGLSHG